MMFYPQVWGNCMMPYQISAPAATESDITNNYARYDGDSPLNEAENMYNGNQGVQRSRTEEYSSQDYYYLVQKENIDPDKFFENFSMNKLLKEFNGPTDGQTPAKAPGQPFYGSSNGRLKGTIGDKGRRNMNTLTKGSARDESLKISPNCDGNFTPARPDLSFLHDTENRPKIKLSGFSLKNKKTLRLAQFVPQNQGQTENYLIDFNDDEFNVNRHMNQGDCIGAGYNTDGMNIWDIVNAGPPGTFLGPPGVKMESKKAKFAAKRKQKKVLQLAKYFNPVFDAPADMVEPENQIHNLINNLMMDGENNANFLGELWE